MGFVSSYRTCKLQSPCFVPSSLTQLQDHCRPLLPSHLLTFWASIKGEIGLVVKWFLFCVFTEWQYSDVICLSELPAVHPVDDKHCLGWPHLVRWNLRVRMSLLDVCYWKTADHKVLPQFSYSKWACMHCFSMLIFVSLSWRTWSKSLKFHFSSHWRDE